MGSVTSPLPEGSGRREEPSMKRYATKLFAAVVVGLVLGPVMAAIPAGAMTLSGPLH